MYLFIEDATMFMKILFFFALEQLKKLKLKIANNS